MDCDLSTNLWSGLCPLVGVIHLSSRTSKPKYPISSPPLPWSWSNGSRICCLLIVYWLIIITWTSCETTQKEREENCANIKRQDYYLSRLRSAEFFIVFLYSHRNGSFLIHCLNCIGLFSPWLPRENIILQKVKWSSYNSEQRHWFGRWLRFVQRGRKNYSQRGEGFSKDRYRDCIASRMLWTSCPEVGEQI